MAYIPLCKKEINNFLGPLIIHMLDIAWKNRSWNIGFRDSWIIRIGTA